MVWRTVSTFGKESHLCKTQPSPEFYTGYSKTQLCAAGKRTGKQNLRRCHWYFRLHALFPDWISTWFYRKLCRIKRCTFCLDYLLRRRSNRCRVYGSGRHCRSCWNHRKRRYYPATGSRCFREIKRLPCNRFHTHYSRRLYRRKPESKKRTRLPNNK